MVKYWVDSHNIRRNKDLVIVTSLGLGYIDLTFNFDPDLVGATLKEVKAALKSSCQGHSGSPGTGCSRE